MSDNENIYARPMNLSPDSERLISILTHLAGIPFEFFGPLVGYLIFKDKGAFVTHHVKESLNFGITMMLAAIILVISIIGLLLVWILPIIWVVFRIVAAVRASQGEFYKYPLTIRFIK